MDEDKIQGMFERLSDKMDKLIEKFDAKMQRFDEKLQNHEVRIVVLEQEPHAEKKPDWKEQLLMLLAKAVVIGGVTIAGLAGCGNLLKGIFRL